jgi:hypothetical protein
MTEDDPEEDLLAKFLRVNFHDSLDSLMETINEDED